MTRGFTLGVTGAGAPGSRGTVHALRTGAASDGVTTSLVGLDARPVPKEVAGFDKTAVVPTPRDPAYISILCGIVDRHGIDVIIPQTTAEVEFLSAHRDELPCPIVAAEASVVRLANNKAEVLKAFRSAGLPCPEFGVARCKADLLDLVEQFGYPLRHAVVKLPVGNGSRGVRIVSGHPQSFEEFRDRKPSGLVTSLPELMRTLDSVREWPELLVMEYLSGSEFSVDAYVGKFGQVAVPRRRDEMRTGISVRTTLVDRSDMAELTLNAAATMQLTGVFGFQFIDTASGPRVIECNPRIQGTMIASLLSGNNLIWLAVREYLDRGLPELSINPIWPAAECVRYWGSVLRHADGVIEVI